MTLRKIRGFTLVEVMVALAIMGIVTAMAWQGIDAVLKAQKYNRARSSEIAVMQTLLAQWDNDLNHIELNSSGNIAPDIPPIQYEKESALLRLVRADDGRADRALRVVAWKKRQDKSQSNKNTDSVMLLRWQSPPIASMEDLKQAWQNAKIWADGSENTALQATELAILSISQWELRPYRQGKWSEEAQDILPNERGSPRLQGLRLVITPATGSIFAGGSITKDWLRPTAPGL
jgi:general secretion pathway protein J